MAWISVKFTTISIYYSGNVEIQILFFSWNMRKGELCVISLIEDDKFVRLHALTAYITLITYASHTCKK